MTKMIGWRARVVDNVREITPHYYREDDSDPGADAISLCECFYAFRKDLVFPGPGMAFCNECGERASRMVRKEIGDVMDTGLGLGTLDHHAFYQVALNALEEGLGDNETVHQEQSCYLIALTNATLALYLLISEKE